MIKRNLDGCYFRVRRGEKYEDLCFTDLTRDEQETVLKDRSPEFIVGLTLHLAKIIRQIGDEFNLRGENHD